MAGYNANELIFIDESSVDKRTAGRRGGWSKRGRRACSSVPFVRGTRYVSQSFHSAAMSKSSHSSMFRYSVLPALSLDGILYLQAVQGSFTKALFTDFIRGLLASNKVAPFPNPNSVIVMDNCRIHKCPEALQLITDA